MNKLIIKIPQKKKISALFISGFHKFILQSYKLCVEEKII